MSDHATSRTGYHQLDLPEASPHRYHTPFAVPIIFLYKLPSPEREKILQSIIDGSKADTATKKNRPVGIIPWLRSFTPKHADIARMASSLAIFIDKTMLGEGLCIICHILHVSKEQFGRHTYEFASVRISEAYDLVTSAEADKSWFPDILDESMRLGISITSGDEAPEKKPGVPCFENEVPVIVVVDITDAQREQLQEMLNADYTTATLISIPNTSNDLDDMDFLMEHFLERAWFPCDFAIVDAQTISELSDLNDKGIAGDITGGIPNYPSFALASEMLIWHGASDEQSVGKDEVGYAIWRRTMEDEDEFRDWCGNCFRGMGLASWGGWWNGDEKREECERYYWGCWLNEKGKVDGEVRGEAVLKY